LLKTFNKSSPNLSFKKGEGLREMIGVLPGKRGIGGIQDIRFIGFYRNEN